MTLSVLLPARVGTLPRVRKARLGAGTRLKVVGTWLAFTGYGQSRRNVLVGNAQTVSINENCTRRYIMESEPKQKFNVQSMYYQIL